MVEVVGVVRYAGDCKVCEHGERRKIDKALVVIGQAPRNLARRYRGITRRDPTRHRDVCLKDAVVVDSWRGRGVSVGRSM